MASFHNWTGDEEIDTQVPQFLNEDNTATQEKLDTKLGKNETAAAAVKDGAGAVIADTYAKKADISGMVKSVNGKEPDAGGNVNVKEYTHPASGVTAGSYRKVTVDTLGHVTAGENPILAVAEGGTGADNATSALSNLGILGAIVNASVSGKTITFTKKDNTKFSIDTQDTNNGIVAALLEQNGYTKFANGLILQWGTYSNNAANFPISFSAVYQAVAVPTTSTTVYGNPAPHVPMCTSLNNDSVKFSSYYLTQQQANQWASAKASGRYIAVGKA